MARSRATRGFGVHRVSIATADGRFGTAADAPGPQNATFERRSATVSERLACFPSSWSRVRIPSPAPAP